MINDNRLKQILNSYDTIIISDMLKIYEMLKHHTKNTYSLNHVSREDLKNSNFRSRTDNMNYAAKMARMHSY